MLYSCYTIIRIVLLVLHWSLAMCKHSNEPQGEVASLSKGFIKLKP